MYYKNRLKICFLKILIAGVLCIITQQKRLWAQETNIRFQHLSIKEGLSQNTINCIFQDSRGFMWFGTQNGLNQFNGYDFKVYKRRENDNSISNDDIRAIHEDTQGNLWIGTMGGLDCLTLSHKKFTNYYHDPDDPLSLSSNIIFTIEEDPVEPDTFLWIGTGNGLNRLNINTGKFSTYYHDPNDPHSLSDNQISVLYQDVSGNLWIGTAEQGLNRFDFRTKSFVRYQYHADDSYSISHNSITTIFQDHRGYLWIGTDGGGLNRFDPDKEKFINYRNQRGNPNSITNDHIRSVCEDHLGNLWIGVEGGGLNRLNKARTTFDICLHDPNNPNSLSTNNVWEVFEDHFENMWVGTQTGGLNKFSITKNYFIHYQNRPDDPYSLSHNNVWCCYEDPDKPGKIFWIGTAEGLNRFDLSNQKFHRFKHQPGDATSLSHNTVWSIIKDDKDLFWIGTSNGLNTYNPALDKFFRYQLVKDRNLNLSYMYVWDLFLDHRKHLWVGTENGLFRIKRINNTIDFFDHNPKNPNSLASNDVRIIFEDKNNIIWIGSIGGGLSRFDEENNCFKNYQKIPENKISISDNRVLCIHEDKRGTMWVGTGGGLNRFDRETEKFYHIMEEDGLPNNVIYGILEDRKGTLWLSTNKGLCNFNPANHTFKNYDYSDGLQSNEFNIGAYTKSETGMMLFGGINGFNTFYPDSLEKRQFFPPVVITDFQIFNRSVPIGDKIDGNIILEKSIWETSKVTLDYQHKVFSFEFVGINYTHPEKNQYAYMMENFEDEWNQVGNRRFATYTNLPPGDYTFRVKASSSEGIWNDQDTSINITITPPFWQTIWFRFLVVVIVVTVIFSWYRIRVRNLQKQKQKLEIQVKERTQEIREKNDQLQEKNSELETLDQVVRVINKEINLENVLQSLLGQAIKLLPQAEKGAFLIYDKDIEKYRYAVVNGYKIEEVKNIHLSEKEVINRYTEHAEQLEEEVYVTRNIKGLSGQKKLKHIKSAKSMLAMSLILEDRLEGFLVLDNMSDKDAFNKTDVHKLLRFREHAISAFIKAKSMRLLEEKNQRILSSIRYGERIQNAILPLTERIRSYLPEHFILYKPRDIVSGDFYWFNQVEGKTILAVVDCTGHGVPGAFMSMLGNAFLNEIITEKKVLHPPGVLDLLHQEVRSALKQGQEKTNTQDGMDVCLCMLEKNSTKHKLIFAGAKRPLYIIKKGTTEVTEIKGDRKSIGGRQREEKRIFTGHELDIHSGDSLYLTTDGFADQQNIKNRRYGSGRLKSFLKTVSDLEIQQQQHALARELIRHQHKEEQRDDITVVGVKI